IYLVVAALTRHLRVDKGAQPDSILRAATLLGDLHRTCLPSVLAAQSPDLYFYDRSTFGRWMRRAVEFHRPHRAGLGRLTDTLEQVDAFGELADAEGTLVHGDFYPDNVLIEGRDVRAVDWEWAGIGAGEI